MHRPETQRFAILLLENVKLPISTHLLRLEYALCVCGAAVQRALVTHLNILRSARVLEIAKTVVKFEKAGSRAF